jgi:hypothetical protein
MMGAAVWPKQGLWGWGAGSRWVEKMNPDTIRYPFHQVGPKPFLNSMIQLMKKKKNDMTNANASPIKIRYSFGCPLLLQTIGTVTNGVKNMAYHNISAMMSNKLMLFSCY